MAEEMTRDQMLHWAAFYLMEASQSDPEITEWDDERTKQRKLERLAARSK